MSTAAGLAPELAQLRASDPGASVWVSASAGTGKTKVLTDRVLSLLLTGTAPHRILCLTFTKASAAEMSNRLARRLAEWAVAEESRLVEDLQALLGVLPDAARMVRARRLFAQVLEAPGGMKIDTIHAFCQSLLRRFPLEAGLAPHFGVMDERDASEILDSAREDVLSSARAGADPALARALTLVTGRIHETGFPELMGELAGERGRLRRLIARHGDLDAVIAKLRLELGLSPRETPDTIIAEACADSAFALADCRAAIHALQQGSDSDGERAGLIAHWLALDEPGRIAGFQAYCLAYHTDKGKIRTRLATKAALAALPGLAEILTEEAERLFAVLDRWRAAVTADCTAALMHLGQALLTAYERGKKVRAQLDYDDLILAARALLSAPGNASWVLYKLDGGIDHVLIDEAQDTNPDQWAVVAALTQEFFAGEGRAENARTIFAVGDEKQSIYSFQRADPRAFDAMRRRFEEAVPASGGEWRTVPLHISFRSTRAVLQAVDSVFTRSGGNGVALFGEYPRHVAYRKADAGLVELWPAVMPRAIDEPEAWKPPVERVRGDSPRARLAALVARRIARMLRDRELLEAKGRPIRAGDVMVLVRRRGAFVEDLVRELKNLDVPVAGADRMVLAEQMAVMDLIALGQFLLLPEDDLTLATVLKGPLVGLSEDELFALAHGRTASSLWAALVARAGEAPFDGPHDLLSRLLAVADYLTPHELYAKVLIAEGGKRRLLGRLGHEAEDPIDEFVALTLAYERLHPPSLQGFLHWLETGAVEIKRDLEQSGLDAVRIMTVHGAKGLQAPIVFLPDTLQMPTKGRRLFWLGEDERELLAWPPRADLQDPVCRAAAEEAKAAREREYRRLLYVAMTRAEDRLYVCGWQTKTSPTGGCWYNLIREGMEAEAGEVTDPFLAEQAETENAKVLRLTCDQDGARKPAPRPKSLEPEAPAEPPYFRANAPSEPSPPRPLAPSRIEGEEAPTRSPLDRQDPSRWQRGSLIHRLLQSLPELDTALRPAATARFLGQKGLALGMTAQAEIAGQVSRLLTDPRFGRIFGPGSRAEVPLVGLIGKHVVSGQVDRILVGADEVLVVDYKTNRQPPKRIEDVPAPYLRQMAAYRLALACIYPGRTIRCALLWTDTPALMELPSRMLDDSLAGLLEAPG
jgi:ATP-dependent helicase/nuclease subunit A